MMLDSTLLMEQKGVRSQHLLQFLHVQRLIQIQTSVLVFVGTGVNEPLQEPLRVKKPKVCNSQNTAIHAEERVHL